MSLEVQSTTNTPSAPMPRRVVRLLVMMMTFGAMTAGALVLGGADPAAAQSRLPAPADCSVTKTVQQAPNAQLASLGWARVAGADRYRFRNNGVVIEASTSGLTRYLVPPNGRQHYSVAAITADGQIGQWRYCGSVQISQPALSCSVGIGRSGAIEIQGTSNFVLYKNGRPLNVNNGSAYDLYSSQFPIEDANTNVGERYHYSIVRDFDTPRAQRRTYCGSARGPASAPTCTVRRVGDRLAITKTYKSGESGSTLTWTQGFNPYPRIWVNGARTYQPVNLVAGRTYHASIIELYVAGRDAYPLYVSTRLYCGSVVA